MDLSRRHREDEIMDQPGLDAIEDQAALSGLGRVNWWSRTAGQIWSLLEELRRDRKLNHLRVLDLACGGGDVTLALARRARSARIPLTVHGCDRSPTAVAYATERCERVGLQNVEFFERDVLNDPIEQTYDVIVCTLFLHHLEQDQAESLLRKMSAAEQAVVVDDLCRSRFGYLLAWFGTRILTRSPVVHTDGPLSVRAAFTTDEIAVMARTAGLEGATIRRHWPERFSLMWVQP